MIDIDLETDQAEDEEGDEEDGEASMSVPAEPSSLERGQIRLSKLGVTHVTREGGTGKSDWISSVLRQGLEDYLTVWNKVVEGPVRSAERAKRLDGKVRRVQEGLEMVRMLDDVAKGPEASMETNEGEKPTLKGGEKDVFGELEAVAKQIELMGEAGSYVRISISERTELTTSGRSSTHAHPLASSRLSAFFPARRKMRCPIPHSTSGRSYLANLYPSYPQQETRAWRNLSQKDG